MKIKKIVPSDITTIDETTARKSFLEGVSTFESLPKTTPPAVVDFLIKTNFVFDKTKTNDKSALLVIGNHTGEWLKYANLESKKDKKQTLIGTVTFDAANRALQIQVLKGAAKPTLIKKQAKEWLKKADVSLEIMKGNKPMTDEDAEKEELAESTIDTELQPKKSVFDWKSTTEKGAELYRLATDFTKTKAAETAKILMSELPSFFEQYNKDLLESGDNVPPPSLIKIQLGLMSVGEKIAESQVSIMLARVLKIQQTIS